MNIFSKIKKLLISGKEVWPLIEGGKGIGISDGKSSGSFAAAGAVGTFSAANARLIDSNGDYVPLVYQGKTRLEKHNELISYSIDAAVSQARIAHDISKGNGRIHMNVLWEMAAVQRLLNGVLKNTKGIVHGITCGAGMPYKLAEIASQYQIYYYPIVSSMRAFRALWQRSYKKYPKNFLGGVVYEDPWLAGGHNGLSNNESPMIRQDPFDRIVEIRSFMNQVELNNVPIIVAGGVWNLRDWEIWINNNKIGPVAFQLGTRPLLTQESPISTEWKNRLLFLKKGDIVLNKFSPTGFYSSAVRNNFIAELEERNNRQIQFMEEQTAEFNFEISFGPRKRKIYIKSSDQKLLNQYLSAGYKEMMKTPDSTIIFVTEEKAKDILNDQRNCMGCLSHCRFSNWKDTSNYNTGLKPDPRSFCIQKTLQNIINETSNSDDELMFCGHNGYKFQDDKLYNQNNIPTVKELIDNILTGN